MSIRILMFLVLGVVAIPASAQQYVEWFPPAEEVTCDSIAVSPEFDERLRRHEVEGITALRVTVDSDGRFSGPIIIERSGTSRENIVLDRHALTHAVKCRLSSPASADGSRTRRLEYQWNFRLPTPLRVK